MMRPIVRLFFLLLPLGHAHAITVAELPLQLQGCIAAGTCSVNTGTAAVTIGQMDAYAFVDRRQGWSVRGYALRYSLLPPSGEDSDGVVTAYGGDLWLTVQNAYYLDEGPARVTVYTDRVSPQPGNILPGDSNGLDIDIEMSGAALFGGGGYRATGLDYDLGVIDEGNIVLLGDGGGEALLPCLAEGCLSIARLNLIYLSYIQTGLNSASLQFDAADNRRLLYRLYSGYDETPENGGYSLTQSYYVAPVPLPAAFYLFASGLMGLFGVAVRKRATGTAVQAVSGCNA